MASTLRIIKWSPPGANAWTVLADGTANPADIITGAALECKPLVDVQEGYGAANVAVYDRGNRRWTFNFDVRRQHADAEAAAAFILTHINGLPNVMDLQITQGAQVHVLSSAGLTGPIKFEEPTGLSTHAFYQFTAQSYA